jgi:hypothetical protein
MPHRGLALYCVLIGLSALPARASVIHLVLDSAPGAWVGAGQNWDVTYTSPADTVVAGVAGTLGNGAPATLIFEANNPSDLNALVEFSTQQLGIPLQDGTYTNAQRTFNEAPGHPGLDVSFDGRGYNTVAGNFTITNVEFAPDNHTLLAFAATFQETGDNFPEPVTGSITYDIAPEPGTFSLAACAGTLALLGFFLAEKEWLVRAPCGK